MSLAVSPRSTEDQPNLTVSIRLARAKALLAQELPMGRVAREVGLSITRLYWAAREGQWLRRSRRDPYSAEVRVEVLRALEAGESATSVARRFGIGKTTLLRWQQCAEPVQPKPVIRWRCYECAPYGVMVEGSTCPTCGTIRAWDEQDDET